MPSMYDYPQVYESLLQRSEEILDAEVDTIQRIFDRHGISSGRVLELACGACPHGIRLAGRGYHVTGVDRSPAMLAEAQRRARAAGVSLHTVQGDIVELDLGESGFDAAIFMFETFPLIIGFTDIARHLNSVRRHVKTNGVYIVDIDVPRSGIRRESGIWGRRTVPVLGGEVETWSEDLPGDWIAGTNHMVFHCCIRRGDEAIYTRDDWHMQAHTPWELGLLARAVGAWTLDGCYSWRGTSTEIADDDHFLAVFIAA